MTANICRKFVINVWKSHYYKTDVFSNITPVRYMAGHSKWANIKHIKGQKDAQRAKEFTKIAQQMKVAIQEGKSANPDHNLQLSHVIEIAKKKSMPVERIQTILKSSQNKSADVKPALLELKGPNGCFMLISLLTDNLAKSKINLQQYFKKANVAMAADCGAKYCFDHKGVIQAKHKDSTSETSLEHAIEAGAEEVTFDEDDKLFIFTCDPKDIHDVHNKLKQLGYDIQESDVSYIPNTFVEINEQQLKLIEKLFDILNEQPDVVSVYDNIA